jgi:hypothetical protein
MVVVKKVWGWRMSMQKGRGGEAEAPRQKRVEVETGQARRLLRRSLGEDESEGVQADWIGGDGGRATERGGRRK